jgi:hypothetical protein
VFLKVIGILAALVLFVTWLGAKAGRQRSMPSVGYRQKNVESPSADDWTEGDEPPEAA